MTWTLEQLAERAARALVDAEVRVANGRVTGVPDGRLIRWYATIGLLDRPLIGPGRVARYGTRHLLQLVAVKRLQAQGLPLAEIQHRLAGATDGTLRRIAALPPGLDEPDDAVAALRPPRRAPARNMPETATPGDGVSAQDAPAGDTAPTRFWAAPPGSPSSEERGARTHRPFGSSAAAPVVVSGDHGLAAGGDTVTRVYGVRIHGLLLFLPAEPAEDDLDAIAAAAQPLLDLLAERGLVHRMAEETPREGAPS